MLGNSRVEANIPAGDLRRAKDFYADKLGLVPVRELMDTAMLYRTDGGTSFTVYLTQYAGQARHTVAQWHVDDLEAEVRDLQAKGVVFETYDLPGVVWDGCIASMDGVGKAAWFTDSEGNVLCIDQEEPAG
jgi:predicted enzyme related to lactoylglutathione lyase